MAYVSRVAKGAPLTHDEMDGNFHEMDVQFLAATDAAASAVSAKDAAVLAQGAAEDARDDAVVAQGAAEDARDDAVVAQGAAESARDAAQLAQGAAESARDDAVLAKIAAEDARDELIDLLDVSAPTIADIQGRIRVLQYADGPYPSLDLQFVGATLTDPALVVERASSATYYDALGRIVTAGANEPRLTFDPATGKSLGLLVEGQGTNLLLWSEDFTQGAWATTRASLTDDDTTAPDGLGVAQKLVEGTQSGTHAVIQHGVSIPVGANVAISVFVKQCERSKCEIRGQSSQGWASRPMASFDIDSGTILSGDGGIEAMSDGWFRVWATGQSGTLDLSGVEIFTVDDLGSVSYTGDGTSGIYVWGAQLETGSVATSYIPTEGSQVTRAADSVSIPVGDWFNPNEGTLLVEGAVLGANTNGFVARLNEAGVNFISAGYVISLGVARQSYMRNGGSNASALAPGGTIQFGSRFKLLTSWRGGDFVAGGNGTLSSWTNQPDGLPEPTELVFAMGVSSTTEAVFSEAVSRVTYYPRALSDAQLIALTTL